MNKSHLFTKKGCTAGFTSDGRMVIGCYSGQSHTWKVWTHEDAQDTRSFGTGQEADAYAVTLIDANKTEELKWW